MKLPILLALVTLSLSCGCETTSGDKAKDARGRAVNQTLVEAGKILGKTVVSMLFNAATSESNAGESDWQQSAVSGLYANLDAATTGDAVQRIVLAYSKGNAPDTAIAANKAFVNAPEKDSAKVNEAIASVISAGTGAPPAQ